MSLSCSACRALSNGTIRFLIAAMVSELWKIENFEKNGNFQFIDYWGQNQNSKGIRPEGCLSRVKRRKNQANRFSRSGGVW